MLINYTVQACNEELFIILNNLEKKVLESKP